jgi:hypothetical protein
MINRVMRNLIRFKPTETLQRSQLERHAPYAVSCGSARLGRRHRDATSGEIHRQLRPTWLPSTTKTSVLIRRDIGATSCGGMGP